MKFLSITSVALAGFTLVACGSYAGREAGYEILESDLGVATATNVAVHSGELNGAYTANLTRKFASEAPASINFAFNSTQLDQTAQTQLRQQAQWIKAHPQIVFRVYGHTDKVGSNADNKRLGHRRAQAVVNYLVSLGVSRSKVKAVSSFGETRPVVLTEGASRANRRTVTEVSGFAGKGSASNLDGKYAKFVYDQYISTTYTVEKSAAE